LTKLTFTATTVACTETGCVCISDPIVTAEPKM